MYPYLMKPSQHNPVYNKQKHAAIEGLCSISTSQWIVKHIIHYDSLKHFEKEKVASQFILMSKYDNM